MFWIFYARMSELLKLVYNKTVVVKKYILVRVENYSDAKKKEEKRYEAFLKSIGI